MARIVIHLVSSILCLVAAWESLFWMLAIFGVPPESPWCIPFAFFAFLLGGGIFAICRGTLNRLVPLNPKP